MLDEMLMASIEGGHLEPCAGCSTRGARVDGDPDSEEIPLGHACWRGRAEMTRELVERGAALSVPRRRQRDRRRAARLASLSATPRAARRCAVDEIPKEPYAEIVRLLLDAGAAVPERIGEDGAAGDDAGRRARDRPPA